MKALIDGDILVHRVAWTTENDPVGIARYRFNEMVEGILREVEAEKYQLFLSDLRENNFRTMLSATYKANRTQPRPKHYEYLKEYAIAEWDARIAYGMEADDALGIAQDYDEDIPNEVWQTCICSIDKDLHQVPGHHWNFVTKEAKRVSKLGGLKQFYKQCILGDRTDNVFGYDGKIRDTKIPKFLLPTLEQLDACVTEQQMFGLVEYLYDNKENLLLNGRLLKIKQQEEEPQWTFPLFETEQAVLSSSTPSKQEVPAQSTERI